MTYALINEKGQIVRYGENIDPKGGTEDGWKWVPVERVPADAEGKAPDGEAVTVEADKVVITEKVRDKTQSEIDAEAATAALAPEVLRAEIDALKARMAEMEALLVKR